MEKKRVRPNINPLYERQMIAFDSPANNILFGGASEGGKSYFVRYTLIAWCTAVANLQCFIVRKHYADVVSNHMEGSTSFRSMLDPWIKAKLVRINENEVYFWNNSKITLIAVAQDKDFEKHQGIEKQVLVFEEATQLKEKHIKGLRGWVRMPAQMKDLLPQQLRPLYPDKTDEELRNFLPKVINTANPIGESVNYFRRFYVEAGTPMVPFFAPVEDGGDLRVYIPSKITDNPSADPVAQRARLLALGEKLAEQLIEGTWTKPIGDFYPEWDENKHVVPDFVPPTRWFKFRTFDWGSADPFCVLWWTVADGTEIMSKYGTKLWFPSGSLVCYREWYGADEEDMKTGLKMRNHDIANGIMIRTPEATSNITLTDSFPFADRGESNPRENNKKYTIADAFAESGIPLMKGNTARIQGWSQLRDRLIGIEKVPLIYFVESCEAVRTYFPALGHHPNNPEDAVEHGEATHALDACRLAATARPLPSKIPRQKEEKSNTISVQSAIKAVRNQKRKTSFG